MSDATNKQPADGLPLAPALLVGDGRNVKVYELSCDCTETKLWIDDTTSPRPNPMRKRSGKAIRKAKRRRLLAKASRKRNRA